MKALIFVLVAVCLPSTLQARQTVVGEWRPANGACTPADGGIVIGPKSITMDAYSCTFDSVSRVGDTVRWRGTCGAPDEAPKRSTVVARLAGERLVIEENGRPHEAPYLRCSSSRTTPRTDKPAKPSEDVSQATGAPYVGGYVSGCLPDVTCLATIASVGRGRYSFEWSARDRSDGMILCKHRAVMTVGTGRHDDEMVENVLQGRLDDKGAEFMVALAGTGKIWIYVNGVGCDRAESVRRRPYMNGVYDRQ